MTHTHGGARAKLVICDAGFNQQAGVGCAAVTGAAGVHTRIVKCATHNVAEAYALLLAMTVAETLNDGRRPPTLTFRTDSRALEQLTKGLGRARGEITDPLAAILGYLERYKQWKVEWARREHVTSAHRVAAIALRRHLDSQAAA